MADPNVPEEELRRLGEELGHVKVSDVLVQRHYTVSSLRVSASDPEANATSTRRVSAIEAITALVPVLEGTVLAGIPCTRFSQVKANMQLA